MSKPHVVFLSPGLYPVFAQVAEFKGGAGGAEVQQAEIIRMLTGIGYPVGIITADFGQQPREKHFGVIVDKFPRGGNRGIKGFRFIYPRLTDIVSLLHGQKPDVIYTRCAGAALAPCVYYAKRHGAKVVYHCANDLEFERGPIPGVSRRDTALFRWALKRTDLVIVQNAHQRESLARNWGREGIVIPNSYEDPTAKRADFDGPVLLVGTIKRIKRPELFVELAKAIPERRFKIIGGWLDRNPETRAFAHGIRDACAQLSNIEFVGGVPFAEVGKHFDGASVVVNTSETEGFPNTFLQAWLRGMPTLSFVAPKDERGVTGTQVATDLPDMERRLRALLHDRDAWARQSRIGEAQYHRNHTSAATAAKYDHLLSELTKPGERRRSVWSSLSGRHP